MFISRTGPLSSDRLSRFNYSFISLEPTLVLLRT